MRSKGFISSLLLCEIKTHETLLPAKTPYRLPDVHQVSKDVVGGVAQVQKTAAKALRLVDSERHRLFQDEGTPTGIEISTMRLPQLRGDRAFSALVPPTRSPRTGVVSRR
ncbi:hypothetical protein [Streptomyces sp. NPDC058653]|uniref:hypothetical protein n=1 Tax=Streptomyces sp. NPDC058653 TaxID=3346576 RepID=UPI0036624E62